MQVAAKFAGNTTTRSIRSGQFGEMRRRLHERDGSRPAGAKKHFLRYIFVSILSTKEY